MNRAPDGRPSGAYPLRLNTFEDCGSASLQSGLEGAKWGNVQGVT
jgi:hypothetical protein